MHSEAFFHLVNLIQSHTKVQSFDDIKITCDLDLGLRKSIKKYLKEVCLIVVFSTIAKQYGR